MLPYISFLLLTQNIACTENFKYQTHQDFRMTEKNERESYIIEFLTERKLEHNNKFLIQYIDKLLLEGNVFRTLETQFPTTKYNIFLEDSIMTLYYSYSLEYFKQVPSKYLKPAIEVIKSTIRYDLSYGKEKFLLHVEKSLNNESELGFIYTIQEGKHPDDVWSETNLLFTSMIMMVEAWQEFTFYDFKQLTAKEQSMILRRHWALLSIGNDNVDSKLLEAMQEEWEIRSYVYMERKKLKQLDKNTSFMAVAASIVQEMMKE